MDMQRRQALNKTRSTVVLHPRTKYIRTNTSRTSSNIRTTIYPTKALSQTPTHANYKRHFHKHHRKQITSTSFNMGKPTGRKTPDTFFVKVKLNGCDQVTINRLYTERDTKALDKMGVKVVAIPERCFKNTAMWKPLVLQDKRSWRETKPRAPSSLRKCKTLGG